jgi:hypothetical protein
MQPRRRTGIASRVFQAQSKLLLPRSSGPTAVTMLQDQMVVPHAHAHKNPVGEARLSGTMCSAVVRGRTVTWVKSSAEGTGTSTWMQPNRRNYCSRMISETFFSGVRIRRQISIIEATVGFRITPTRMKTASPGWPERRTGCRRGTKQSEFARASVARAET